LDCESTGGPFQAGVLGCGIFQICGCARYAVVQTEKDRGNEIDRQLILVDQTLGQQGGRARRTKRLMTLLH
jgi:hypothetical protein